MTTISETDYPLLTRLFGAYLNADWPHEYGAPAAAFAAYRQAAPAIERRAVLAELVRLRATTSTHVAFSHALNRLGAEVYFSEPSEAHALGVALVEALREAHESDT